jgi:hypothetical protein
MRYEYMTLKFAATGWFAGGDLDGDAFNGKLNELGMEGWELVSVFDTNMMHGRTRDVVAVFKRSRR